MPLKLQYEWIDPAGAKGRELRATWARLEIEIDGHVVTRAIDDVSRSVRDSVYLPLYPLAEWLVTNWWFLLYEVEPRRFGAGDGYYGRHSLRSAGEGFALPALLFSPTGSTIQALWRPADLDHHRLEFTERGHATIRLMHRNFAKRCFDSHGLWWLDSMISTCGIPFLSLS
jgi:hypothetical protein